MQLLCILHHGISIAAVGPAIAAGPAAGIVAAPAASLPAFGFHLRQTVLQIATHGCA